MNKPQDFDQYWKKVEDELASIQPAAERTELHLRSAPEAKVYADADVRNSISGWIDPDLLQEQAKYAINRAYRFVPYFSDWETEAWGEFQEVINGGDANSTLNQLAENWKELKDEY